MVRKVLITDRVHNLLIDGLKELGYQVDYYPEFDPHSLIAEGKDYYGIIINSKIRMYSEELKSLPNLRFIGRLGSGLEIIDLRIAEEMGIRVFNSPEGNRNAVAEHAMGMLLTLYNNIINADAQLRKRNWDREVFRGRELDGKTFGIIGLGNTGGALAGKLSGWTHELIYNDPYVLNSPKEISYISKVSLKEIQRRCDVISLHVPLTPETNRMVDEEFIANCLKKPVIINTSRGAVVDTRALLNGLKTGRISGACLDVFENEKPQSFTAEEDQLYQELYDMSNVVLTPHIAGWTEESFYKIANVLLDKIAGL